MTTLIAMQSKESPTRPAVQYRSYSRLKEDGLKESWAETCLRTVNGIAELGRFTDAERASVLAGALEMTTLPSGRSLWVAGTPYAKQLKNVMSNYNCLGGGTMIEVMVGSEVDYAHIEDVIDEPVIVRNGNGNWVEVTFTSYGFQSTKIITFQKVSDLVPGVRYRVKVQASLGHEWPIIGGARKETQDLQYGDLVADDWSVVDIQDVPDLVEVFCCTEEETGSFYLTDNLLTHNCSSQAIDSWEAMASMMDVAMTGCGTGCSLENRYINKLPPIVNTLDIKIMNLPGAPRPAALPESAELTVAWYQDGKIKMIVGDSREGWASAYLSILRLASSQRHVETLGGRVDGPLEVEVHLYAVRPAGTPLKGFGGIANPVKLPEMFLKMQRILNGAAGRQLDVKEVCLLIDNAALVVVAGNIRRCLPEDALVHTIRGLVPIKDVQVGDRVQTPIGFRRVTSKFDQGVQEVREIETNATFPRATENHRVAVYDSATGDINWKQVSELTEADRLMHSSSILPGVVTHLPLDFTQSIADETKKGKKSQDFVVPDLTTEVAWLIGFTHGNGYVYVKRSTQGSSSGFVKWTMNCSRPGLTEVIQSKIEVVLKQFGLTATHLLHKNRNCGISQCSSIRFAEYFLRYIKQPEASIVVPSFILQGGVEIRAAYLAGVMDSGGGVKNRLPKLLTSTYPNFVRQVACILSSLGIAGRVSSEVNRGSSFRLMQHLTIPAMEERFNELIAPYSAKGSIRTRRKTCGFSLAGVMMEDAYSVKEMRRVGSNGSFDRACNSESYSERGGLNLDVPVTFRGLGKVDVLPTYDIEVEEAHCFYCDGYLTHNSAGLRLFDEDAPLLKQNLWQEDEHGNWRIDPERDAMRIANHTRAFHRKPSYQEIEEAVKSQFYSGEGAIQYAPEAIARASADVLHNKEKKAQFLHLYSTAGREAARDYLEELGADEVEDRMNRYQMNPCSEIIGNNFTCVSGETLIITEEGLSPIKELVGRVIRVWNGLRWSDVVPVQTSRDSELLRVQFGDGSFLDCTPLHKFYVKDRFQKDYQMVYAKDLSGYSKYQVHTEPFRISYETGLSVDLQWAYTLGVIVGDGTTGQGNAVLRLFGEKTKLPVIESGRFTLEDSKYREGLAIEQITGIGKMFDYELIKRLKTQPKSLELLASWSKDAILNFVAGLADTDGSNTAGGGIRIYVSDGQRAHRIQLLLTKCGVRSSVNLCSRQGTVTNYGARKQDLYYLQITECQEIPCHRLDVSQGHSPTKKGEWQIIKSVEELPGLHDTYCFEEPERHKAVFGNSLTGQCNLSEIHLNKLNPLDFHQQKLAFERGGLIVSSHLYHKFPDERFQKSRNIDPIVGISFTGLFDFFVNLFGTEWLQWWMAGRPKSWGEKKVISMVDPLKHLTGAPQVFMNTAQYFSVIEFCYLDFWKRTAEEAVREYCKKHGLRCPNRFTTLQPAGCLTKDALRVFDSGLYYADEHMGRAAKDVDLSEYRLSVREGIDVRYGISNEEREIIKVTLNNGRQIQGTLDHKLEVNGQWVELKDLQIGSLLSFQLGAYRNSSEATLEHVDVQIGLTGRQPRRCILPEKMSPILGYLIGVLFGNGHCSQIGYRLRFSHGNVDVLNRISDISLQLFGIPGVMQRDKKGGKHELCIASKQLCLWLKHNGISNDISSKDLDRIPLKIRESSSETVLAFFAGLVDTDGCIREDGALSIDSAAESFIRNLQQVGEAVGLCFSIFQNTEGENPQEIKTMFGLSLSRTKSELSSIEVLNRYSIKAKSRRIRLTSQDIGYEPYQVTAIERGVFDYTYDYTVEAETEDDSWYWQGAIKSHNSKSLLTGASPGWHPPYATRYIRRITFAKNDPIALAHIDYGYTVVPSQSDTDENGNLLNDPHDPRCTEWLVEIPVEVPWAGLADSVGADPNEFPVEALFDFYMQVQRYYVQHQTSATISFREKEIPVLSGLIYKSIQEDSGYISSALLARMDSNATFPRLPFEPVSKDTYEKIQTEVLERRKSDDFHALLDARWRGQGESLPDIACEGMSCEMRAP